MAKPIPNNAEYFSHDADMRNDPKIRAIRRKFSLEGYAVWCFLLESIADADFFELKYDTIARELLAADYDIDVDKLEAIVDYCCQLGMLQKNESGTVITCEKLKERLAPLIEKREKQIEIQKVRSEAGKNGMQNRWANSITKTDSYINQDNKTEDDYNKTKFCYSSPITLKESQDNKTEDDYNKTKFCYSSPITLKESKVKESKVKDIEYIANENFTTDKSVRTLENENPFPENKTINLNIDESAKPKKEKSCAKKEKEPMHQYGEYKNVLLTDKEAQNLRDKYGGDAVGIVQNYSEYKEMKGYKCKRDYLAIRKWGVDAYYEQIKKQNKSYGTYQQNNPDNPGYVSTERIIAAARAMHECNN